ncbi:hypothetical protein EDM57_00460 [Brevibacillus gelatini]|uniref:Uncharacterized protein n=1 Tax=Brevibacillus gelatini TaxID=1655277 RepID=A0A3M8BDT7_9BACL|nr:hypothetical protein EDM57_00460 [Brevibacillus gelatini]
MASISTSKCTWTANRSTLSNICCKRKRKINNHRNNGKAPAKSSVLRVLFLLLVQTVEKRCVRAGLSGLET